MAGVDARQVAAQNLTNTFASATGYKNGTIDSSDYAKGQQQFYWEYKQFREQPVFPGDKQAVVVLRVPRGMTQVSAQLDYEAVVAETLFGIVYKKNIKSGVLPVSWKLPKS